MKTELHTATSPAMVRAAELIKSCVHCGFCTATCPSYQIMGDELDSPRGRIYLIKEMIERRAATDLTRQHLDRCLLCRNCETTCPSGVQYGELLSLGRHEAVRLAPRSWMSRMIRQGLIVVLSNRRLFGILLTLGQWSRPLLPAVLKQHIPPLYAHEVTPKLRARIGQYGKGQHDKGLHDEGQYAKGQYDNSQAKESLILFEGCAQPALNPNIGAASTALLEAAGYRIIRLPQLGCCGAIAHHLEGDAHATIKRNIDHIIPLLDAGVTGIVFDASGCGLMLKDYAKLLSDDPVYAERAQRVATAAQDLSVWLLPKLAQLKKQIDTASSVSPSSANPSSANPSSANPSSANPSSANRLAYHPPCSLQHGLKQKDGVLEILKSLDFDVVMPAESHLCCGSAGTYSILQSKISGQLRERKLGHLDAALTTDDGVIVSANIGCIHHLQGGTPRPVRHWAEVVADKLI